MEAKSIFKSKYFWFNILTGITFIATNFFGYEPNTVVEGNLRDLLPLFNVVGNIVLRFFTKQPVTL